MKGYFSRLINQTGINIGNEVRSEQTTIAVPQNDSKDGGETSPTHIEEIELIQPRPDHPAEQNKNDQEGQHSEKMKISKEGRHETQINNSTKKQLHQENLKSKNPKFKSEDLIEEKLLRQKEDLKVSSNTFNRKKSEKREVYSEKSKQLENYPTYLTTPKSDQNSIFKLEDAAKSEGINKQTSFSTFREIREWVAETSASGELERNKQQRLPFFQPEFVQSFKEINADKGHLHIERNLQPDALEIQHNQISIGAISVTIEEPAAKSPVSPSIHKTTKQQSVQKNYSSRLRRHYLRIR